MDNEVMELIDMLYTMVSEAWGVPLGNDKCIVEREKALKLIEEIKAQLPVELSEAKRLVAARDEFIGNAKREAESLRRAAEERARRLIDEQEIVRISQAKSSELIANAESRSRELRRVATEYVDDALRRSEEAMSSAPGGAAKRALQLQERGGTGPAAAARRPAGGGSPDAGEVVPAPLEAAGTRYRRIWRPLYKTGAKFHF